MLLQSAASVGIAATSVASALACAGNLYGGRSAAHVWWYGWVTALSTGLGALPMLIARDLSEWWVGLADALAGGMMTAASACLVSEALELPSEARTGLTALQGVVLGFLVGIGFIRASKACLDGCGDVRLGILEGVNARRALLIVLVMTLHSFSEGIGIGVSFGKDTSPQLGMLITTTLAVHNVPEGFAVSTILVSKGMSVWGASLWSIFTSIPQPLMAILAFRCVDTFAAVQPIGLGFAAGAMVYVAWMELLAEAHEACGATYALTVATGSAVLMGLCHTYLL